VLNGILWKLRTGAPWRDLPERYGPWKTAHERLRLWTADGTWDKILAEVIVRDDAVGELEWVISVDSSVVGAHQHAAGARKGAARPRSMRLRSRAKGSDAPAED
jgi:transposase